MSLPPLLISARTTALAFCRVAVLATSKTSAVPRPTGGRGSPVEGIGRVNKDAAGCAKAGKGKFAAPVAKAATGKLANCRRVSLFIKKYPATPGHDRPNTLILLTNQLSPL